MESSTSVYWRPVHNVLEDTLDVILVNVTMKMPENEKVAEVRYVNILSRN